MNAPATRRTGKDWRTQMPFLRGLVDAMVPGLLLSLALIVFVVILVFLRLCVSHYLSRRHGAGTAAAVDPYQDAGPLDGPQARSSPAAAQRAHPPRSQLQDSIELQDLEHQAVGRKQARSASGSQGPGPGRPSHPPPYFPAHDSPRTVPPPLHAPRQDGQRGWQLYSKG